MLKKAFLSQQMPAGQVLQLPKDWRLKKLTKVYSRFLIEKKSEFFYPFTCIFPDHMVYEITT